MFALEFLCTGKLTTKEFEEAARARTAVGAKQAHAIKEDEKVKDFGVFDRAEGFGRGIAFGFVDEGGEGVVELALNERRGRIFVDDAGGESFVGFGESLERSEDIGIGGKWLVGGEFGNGEGDGGKKTAVGVDYVRRDADIEQRSIGRERARMLVFVAVGGEKVATMGRAVDGDFTLGAATDRANLLGFGRTETAGLTFVANRTEHERSPGEKFLLIAFQFTELCVPTRSETTGDFDTLCKRLAWEGGRYIKRGGNIRKQ